MNGFKGYQAFLREIQLTVESVTLIDSLQTYAVELQNAVDNLKEVTTSVMAASKDPKP